MQPPLNKQEASTVLHKQFLSGFTHQPSAHLVHTISDVATYCYFSYSRLQKPIFALSAYCCMWLPVSCLIIKVREHSMGCSQHGVLTNRVASYRHAWSVCGDLVVQCSLRFIPQCCTFLSAWCPLWSDTNMQDHLLAPGEIRITCYPGNITTQEI